MAVPRPPYDRAYESYTTSRTRNFKVINFLSLSRSKEDIRLFNRICGDLAIGYPVHQIEAACRKQGYYVTVRQIEAIKVLVDEQISITT